MFLLSLFGANDFPAMVLLTDVERLLFCDDDFFRLIKILMICDSQSYMYVMDEDNRMDRCIAEFDFNNKDMMKNWEKNIFIIKKYGKGCC